MLHAIAANLVILTQGAISISEIMIVMVMFSIGLMLTTHQFWTNRIIVVTWDENDNPISPLLNMEPVDQALTIFGVMTDNADLIEKQYQKAMSNLRILDKRTCKNGTGLVIFKYGDNKISSFVPKHLFLNNDHLICWFGNKFLDQQMKLT